MATLTPPTIADALVFLRPGAIWNLRGSTIEWLDATQIEPTPAEIQNALTQLQANQVTLQQAISNAQSILQAPVTTVNPDPRIGALITLLQAGKII